MREVIDTTGGAPCPDTHLDVLVEVRHAPWDGHTDCVDTYTLDAADEAPEGSVVLKVRVPRLK